MTDIDHLAAQSYSLGKDAIAVAIDGAAIHLQLRDVVRAGRAEDPTSFPGYGKTDEDSIAARIIGELLGAGWTPPTDEAIKAAADGARAASERFQTWIDGLTNNQREYAMGYFGEHGVFPSDCRPPKAGEEQGA